MNQANPAIQPPPPPLSGIGVFPQTAPAEQNEEQHSLSPAQLPPFAVQVAPESAPGAHVRTWPVNSQSWEQQSSDD
jgi:hypothetical protein